MAGKTRLIVKNLPKHLTDERLRSHFASQGAEITDARILHTPDGKSRQFGFIGLRTEAEARAVISYFNGTYLDTSRLSVELAKPVGDRSGAWSRHTPGTSAYNARHHNAPYAQEEKAQGKGAAKPTPSSPAASSKAAEALVTLKPRASQSRPYWANDDTQAAELKRAVVASSEELKGGKRVKKALVPSRKHGAVDVLEQREHVVFEDSGASDEEGAVVSEENNTEAPEAQRDETIDAEPTVAANEQVSDLDYLRSKMSENFNEKKMGEEAEEDEGEEQEGEEVEGKEEEKKDKKGNKEKHSKKNSDSSSGAENGAPNEVTGAEEAEEDVAESGRLMFRNLPFTITEEELLQHVQRFGPVTELRLPLDPTTRRPRGLAFVLYMVPHDAVKALKALDGSPFQGRLLHVMPARAAPTRAPAEGTAGAAKRSEGKRTAVQEEKEAKKKAAGANEGVWNALFMRSDAVASAAARGLGVEKAELLTGGASPALQLALAETSVVAETRSFLAAQGVSLTALEQAVAGQKTARSTTVLLVKNLPPDTEEAELQTLLEKHGAMIRLVLPPSRAVALAEYAHAPDARAAFRSLNYARFHHVPLFLEWAPESTFTSPPPSAPSASATAAAPAAATSEKKRKEARVAATEAVSEAVPREEGDVGALSVFVKNLSFASSEADLKAHVEALGVKARTVSVATKKDPIGRTLSMGFGFIECTNRDDAHTAVRLLHGSQLGGHTLIAKLSTRTSTSSASGVKRRKGAEVEEQARSRKVLVKNLAFEATPKELRGLFEPFGAVQRVRIPRKPDGSHRGFAFVEMATKQDAQNALKALSATHLYGRRLVLEFAKDEEAKSSASMDAPQVDHNSDFIPL